MTRGFNPKRTLTQTLADTEYKKGGYRAALHSRLRDAGLGYLPDRCVASIMGVSVPSISVWRNMLGVEKCKLDSVFVFYFWKLKIRMISTTRIDLGDAKRIIVGSGINESCYIYPLRGRKHTLIYIPGLKTLGPTEIDVRKLPSPEQEIYSWSNKGSRKYIRRKYVSAN